MFKFRSIIKLLKTLKYRLRRSRSWKVSNRRFILMRKKQVLSSANLQAQYLDLKRQRIRHKALLLCIRSSKIGIHNCTKPKLLRTCRPYPRAVFRLLKGLWIILCKLLLQSQHRLRFSKTLMRRRASPKTILSSSTRYLAPWIIKGSGYKRMARFITFANLYSYMTTSILKQGSNWNNRRKKQFQQGKSCKRRRHQWLLKAVMNFKQVANERALPSTFNWKDQPTNCRRLEISITLDL